MSNEPEGAASKDGEQQVNTHVALLTYTADPERVVAVAARTCYSEKSPPDIWAEMTDPEKVAKAICIIKQSGHESPIEHASFTFALSGVSRSLLAQITRHRLAFFSVQSQRYVQFKDAVPIVLPKSIVKNQELCKIYEDTATQTHRTYQTMIDNGVPAEDARFILPEATCTNIVMTMNARELRHFFSLRCCQRAQWEIRAVAEEMYKLVYPIAPPLFDDAGPSCVASGKCPEGKKSCGRIDAVKKLYGSIREGVTK